MEKEEGMEALRERKKRQYKEMYEGGDSEGDSKEQRLEESKVEVRIMCSFPFGLFAC